jgi:DNA-binding response OmpR family regulator
MNPWIVKALVLAGTVVMIAIRAPHGRRSRIVKIATSHKTPLVVRHRGRELNITPVEYSLLLYFIQNIGRDVILNSVWGYEVFPNLRTVDAHVLKLRQKLEADPNIPRHFVTVVGVGYRFVP